MQNNYTEFKSYKIINKLNILDLFSTYYLVSKESKYYILRIFNENLNITDEVVEKIKEITNELKKHLCVIYEFDYKDKNYYQKNYYQILEYPVYGNLSNYIKQNLSINSNNNDILNKILKVFNDDKELYLEFIKNKENFDLALKFFFNYIINKLNLKDYKIFNEIKNELENEKEKNESEIFIDKKNNFFFVCFR